MKLTRRGEKARDALLTVGLIACLLLAGLLEGSSLFL